MAVLTEDWVRDIEEILFSGQNEFIGMSVDHDEFVVNKTVHVPQAGSLAAVDKNRVDFPAPVEQRDDTDLEYDLDSYFIRPVRIGRIEDIQVSYQKRTSVMGHHHNKLKNRIALECMNDWSTNSTSEIVLTTGDAGVANGPKGSTGTRKKITVDDLLTASGILDDNDIPDDGRRVLLMPANMYRDLFTINDLLQSDIIGKTTLPQGVIDKILNMNIMKRSFALTYTAGGAKNPVNTAIASDDNAACILWHPDFVAKALGEINFYDEEGSPTMYGDVISSDVLFKGTRLRSTGLGLVNIRQDN